MSDHEERELDREESYERDLADLDVELALADESRDDLEVTLTTQIPVRCVVFGHNFRKNQFGLTFCATCGADQYDEVGQTGARL